MTSPLVRGGRLLLLPLALLLDRLGNRFYPLLAVLLAVLTAAALYTGQTRGMQNQAFDLVMANRLQVPAPHPDVVLVDIDEASLAALAPQHGRWPWPRSTMAAFIEGLAAAGPRAIIFDITFVDRDLTNPDGDAWLAEVAAATPNSHFAMVRLNPDNDALSELRLAELSGVWRHDPTAAADATAAFVVPYFHSRLGAHQLGTINLYAGDDGVTRRYHLYRDIGGWRVGSLPANVVAALGGAVPDSPDILLNWRGPPGSYPTESFHTLFTALMGPDAATAASAYAGKVVLVGSTAPSLFDITATPVSKQHPGLEVLATALDNVLKGDHLQRISPLVDLATTLAVLGLLTLAFVYNLDHRVLNPVFTTVQLAFLAITFLVLSVSNTFVDLSAPFTAALVYFTLARAWSLGLVLRRNGNPWLSSLLDPGAECRVLLVRCALPDVQPAQRRVRGLLLRLTGLTTSGVPAPRMFRQSPLLAELCADTLLVYWLVAPSASDRALADLYRWLASAVRHLGERGFGVRFDLDSVTFQVDEDDAWHRAGRTALAAALAPDQDQAPDGHPAVYCSASFAQLARTQEAVAAPAMLAGALDAHADRAAQA